MALMALALAAIAGQASTWTEADRQAAVAVAEQKGHDWQRCLVGALKRYEATGEEPKIIATASFGACAGEEQAYRTALATSFRGLLDPAGRDDQADQIVAEARHHFEEFATADILDRRLKPNPKRGGAK